MVASREPVGHERRIDDRHAVDVPVTLRAYRVSPIDARMVDVSAGGAMVALASEAIGRGDEIMLAAHGLELVATIAWATDDFCGLAFHRRLQPSEVAAIRRGAGRTRAAH